MFQIDAMSRTPVYEQIVAQAEKLISAGLLRPGDQLPSVRSLSIKLSVNPNTIQRAYGTLDTMGLIVSVPGKGCFVSDSASVAVISRNKKRLTELSSLAAELCSAGVSAESIISAVEDGIKTGTERKENL
ncbi:MAG: GntR family transcriptional regulator [Clostridia bacterium]|nr:GntR family transcriptional regulator [Clostridia bacterium]